MLKKQIKEINDELEELFNNDLILYMERLGTKINEKDGFEKTLIQNGISQTIIDKLNEPYKYYNDYLAEKEIYLKLKDEGNNDETIKEEIEKKRKELLRTRIKEINIKQEEQFSNTGKFDEKELQKKFNYEKYLKEDVSKLNKGYNYLEKLKEVLLIKISDINRSQELMFNEKNIIDFKLVKIKENYEKQLLYLGISKDEIQKLNKDFRYINSHDYISSTEEFFKRGQEAKKIREERIKQLSQPTTIMEIKEKLKSAPIPEKDPHFIEFSKLNTTPVIIDLYKKINEIHLRIDELSKNK